MKKLIMGLLIVTLLISNLMVFADNNKLTAEEKVQSFFKQVTTYEGFKVWDGEKLSKKIDLYNSDGNISAYLFNVENKGNVIGYIIQNANTMNICEYALGQSPYEDYLHAYLDAKKDIFKDKQIQLLFDGQNFYGIKDLTSKDKKVYDFTNDESVDIRVNTTSHVDKLKQEKNLTTELSTNASLSSSPVQKVLLVPNITWYRACGPTAGANVMRYWSYTYPSLAKVGSTDLTYNQMVDELYSRMGSIGMFTDPVSATTGLQNYTSVRNIHVKSNLDFIPLSYSTFVNEINYNRPVISILVDHPYYGNHYVTVVGYAYQYSPYDNIEQLVYHDSWTMADVYRNWSDDSYNTDWIIRTYPY